LIHFSQTVSLYSIVSKTLIPEQTPNCKGALLPYHPGFKYAALKSTDSSHDYSLLVFNSKPPLLDDDIKVMDASERKVKTNIIALKYLL
jgi:hypothetical protein